MLYSDIQANIKAILNRRDCTQSQLLTFIGLAIQRIQRTLRVPSMEAQANYTYTGAENSLVPVPGDLLEVIDLTFNDQLRQRKLTRVDHQSAIRLSNLPGNPTSYYRVGGNFLVGPNPPAGTVITIWYYQDAANLSADGDHNWLTDAAPDCLIYCALSYAADFFLDDRKDSFEQRFASIQSELQSMAQQDELMNASISPAYADQGGPWHSPTNWSY